MSLLSVLRGESRALDASTFNLGDDLFPARTAAGVTVTHETAMNLIAVYACVTLIADAVSSLPVDVFRNQGGERQEVSRRPAWLGQPNPETTWRQFTSQLLHSLLIAGNAYTLITARDSLAYPTELWVLHPAEVSVRRTNRAKQYLWVPEGRTFDQFTAARPNGQVLHTMGHSADGVVGLSPIDQAQQAVGLGQALEQFGARFFGNGSQMSGFVELPQGSQATEDQLRSWAAMWRKKFSGVENAWKTPVLGNGATFKSITLPNDQAQFLESRKFNTEEIARLYRVPPHLVGDVERSTSWGSGIEQQGIGFVTYTLNPWITRLEDSFSQLLPQNEYVKWNVNALVRGDMQTRYQSYVSAVQNGWMTRNEVREKEDMPPRDELDAFLQPLNMSVAGNVSLEDNDTVADIVGKFIRAGFTPESAVAAATSGDTSQLVHTGRPPVTLKDEGVI